MLIRNLDFVQSASQTIQGAGYPPKTWGKKWRKSGADAVFKADAVASGPYSADTVVKADVVAISEYKFNLAGVSAYVSASAS
ncbi:MAG: hypothetical protein VKL20_00165 [Synechocystis sp.]|nr:hypothetical protein [Synechocystis sp.]